MPFCDHFKLIFLFNIFENNKKTTLNKKNSQCFHQNLPTPQPQNSTISRLLLPFHEVEIRTKIQYCKMIHNLKRMLLFALIFIWNWSYYQILLVIFGENLHFRWIKSILKIIKKTNAIFFIWILVLLCQWYSSVYLKKKPKQ